MLVLLRRSALLGMGFAALCLAPAGAEMLQFPNPDDGMKSWPKLETIDEWHQDQDASMKLAANVIIPDGADPAPTATLAVCWPSAGVAPYSNQRVVANPLALTVPVSVAPEAVTRTAYPVTAEGAADVTNF